MVPAWPCIANTSCNWCQIKEDKMNFLTMSTFADKSLVFRKIHLIFMGFLFAGTHCTCTEQTLYQSYQDCAIDVQLIHSKQFIKQGLCA